MIWQLSMSDQKVMLILLGAKACAGLGRTGSRHHLEGLAPAGLPAERGAAKRLGIRTLSL